MKCKYCKSDLPSTHIEVDGGINSTGEIYVRAVSNCPTCGACSIMRIPFRAIVEWVQELYKDLGRIE